MPSRDQNVAAFKAALQPVYREMLRCNSIDTGDIDPLTFLRMEEAEKNLAEVVADWIEGGKPEVNAEAVEAARLKLQQGADDRWVYEAILAALPHLTDDERYGEIVAGQGRIYDCGCGYPSTTFDGQVLHLFNERLTGTDDHDAHLETP